jgi:hypothetical protein
LVAGESVIESGEDQGGYGAVDESVDGTDYNAAERVGCMEPRVDRTGQLQEVEAIARADEINQAD